MLMSQIIRLIKDVKLWAIIRYLNLSYYRFVRVCPFIISSTEETIDYIIKHRVSVSRYGDGEYRVMNNCGNGFQTPNVKLSKRLLEILQSRNPKHIICIPHTFSSVKGMKPFAQYFWMNFIVSNQKQIKNITPKEYTYHDALFTRFYVDYKDKSDCGRIIQKIKKIWQGRHVYIIEGRGSKLGVGNDLFDNADGISRIICPGKDAFSLYDNIYNKVVEIVPSGSLILLALGMTATVLAYDLSTKGYQAIDIGHIDIEYCWFLMGAKEKCPIPGKAVNEVSDGANYTAMDTPPYTQSIIAEIDA